MFGYSSECSCSPFEQCIVYQLIVLLFFKISFISAKYFQQILPPFSNKKIAFKIIKINGNFLSNLYFLLVVVVHTCIARPLQWSREIIPRDIKTRVSGSHNTRVWKSNLGPQKEIKLNGKTKNLAFQSYSVH